MLRRWWVRGSWLLPAAVAVLLLRARYLFTPITADEGGYLAEARAWGRGAVLYRDVWVDRPQGLLLLFRIWNDMGLGSPIGVRVLALLACLVGAGAAGLIARRLAGPSAGWMAALAVGVLASIPQQEGFIANAELLSSAVGIVALAFLLAGFWDRDRPWYRILALAGVLEGCALSIKQSGFDAFLAGMFLLLAVSLSRRWAVRDRLLAIPVVIAGVAVPLIGLMIHGAVTGWHRWWYAFAGYRLDQRSALKNAEWERYHETAALMMPKLWPAIALCVAAMIWGARRRQIGAAALLLLWSGLAILAFLLGGQFFRHYWVIFAFPLGTACGALLSLVRPRALRMVMLAGMLLVPVWSTANSLTIPRDRVGPLLSDDVRLVKSEKIGAWFEENKRPGENIYAMCASAALYGNVDTDPPYPYLWFALIPQVPGARRQLVSLMAGPDAPTYVALFQPASLCDPSGSIGQSMAERYERIGSIEGIAIYRRLNGR